MRRWIVPALMTALLLTGCGKSTAERKLDEAYGALAAAEEISVTADVTASLGNERFSCTLECTAGADGATVEVKAPETIAGIRAVVGADGTTIEYAGLSLGIGGRPDSAPVTALPLLLGALRSGSTLRSWTEWEEGRTLFVRDLYVTDDTALTVWFDAEALQPVHAEFARGGETVLRCEIREFSYR